MTRKAQYLLGAKLLLSFGLLALVLTRVDPHSVLKVLATVDVPLVIAWYAFVPVAALLAAWRWKLLAPALSFSTALKYTWIGLFYGHVLPGAISGDIAKGLSLAFKDNAARAGLAASIVAEKVIGLAALLLFFDIACAVIYVFYGDAFSELRQLAVIALVLSGIGVAAGIVLLGMVIRLKRAGPANRPPAVAHAAYSVVGALQLYSTRPIVLLKGFLISLVIHIVGIFAFYVSFRALHVDAGILFASVAYPVVSVMILIPLSVSGIGVRDATLAVLFSLFGLPPASGVAISWLALFATVPNIAIGGTVQFLEMYRTR